MFETNKQLNQSMNLKITYPITILTQRTCMKGESSLQPSILFSSVSAYCEIVIYSFGF